MKKQRSTETNMCYICTGTGENLCKSCLAEYDKFTKSDDDRGTTTSVMRWVAKRTRQKLGLAY